jgi:hypothetical protein
MWARGAGYVIEARNKLSSGAVQLVLTVQLVIRAAAGEES